VLEPLSLPLKIPILLLMCTALYRCTCEKVAVGMVFQKIGCNCFSLILNEILLDLFFKLRNCFFGKCVYKRGSALTGEEFLSNLESGFRLLILFKYVRYEVNKMCKLRAGLVKNCRRCKSSIRVTCTEKKKVTKKFFADNKKKGASTTSSV
jgi:hypothetical protein